MTNMWSNLFPHSLSPIQISNFLPARVLGQRSTQTYTELRLGHPKLTNQTQNSGCTRLEKEAGNKAYESVVSNGQFILKAKYLKYQ